MNKDNCYTIEMVLRRIFDKKKINIEIDIINKYSKGNLSYKMRIKVPEEYKHLLEHIYATCYSICSLDGEYLTNKKIRGNFLYFD
jgi:hypothetical protein